MIQQYSSEITSYVIWVRHEKGKGDTPDEIVMSLVQGEDSESDEEINTDQLQSLVLTPDGSIRDYQGLIRTSSQQKTAGIVMGEESETDEEEEEGREGSDNQPDSGWDQVKAPLQSSQTSLTSTPESPRAESLEPITAAPQS